MTARGRAAAAGLVVIVLAGRAGAQATEPLRNTDLIRLLTSGTMTPPQIAALVQRNCLSFRPTSRDRDNLITLGADSAILARIDLCGRRSAGSGPPAAAVKPVTDPPRPRPAPPAARPPAVAPAPPARLVAVPLTARVRAEAGATVPVRVRLRRGARAVPGTRLVLLGTGRLGGASGEDAEAATDKRGIAQFRFAVGSAPGTVRLAVATAAGETLAAPAEIELTVFATAPSLPAAPMRFPAPDRTAFVLGSGQRGRVGESAPFPVVFEVRDSSGTAMAGVAVSLTIVNGRLVGAPGATDSVGQVRAQVVFGERAGVPTVVTGVVGAIVRQATLYPSAGLPSQLVVLSDGNALAGQVVVLAGRPAQLRIFCRDSYGNALPLVGLRATVGDAHVIQVTHVTSDSLGGSITVAAERGGSTNLVIQGSGLRSDFSALVRP